MNNSKELGLPLFYKEYPEYFDVSSSNCNSDAKNKVIEALLRKYHVNTIFDMTCGTGSQVLFLSKLGYKITGSDFSPGLLDIARKKLLREQIKANLIEGDLRDLQVDRFDAVITIDNSIGHLIKKDFVRAIRNIYQNLKEGGIYIFDILDLSAMTDEVIELDNSRMTDQITTNDGTIIYNIRQSKIDREKGYFISNNSYTIQKDEEQKKITNKVILQIYTKSELKNILSKEGFKVIEQYNMDAYTFEKDKLGYSVLTVVEK